MFFRMISDHSVPARLAALRDKAGLSIREMAGLVGMSPSGYGHYENPERFKARYLPMAQAKLFASVFSSRGVDEADVLALAGQQETSRAPMRVEDAAPGSDLVAVYNVSASAGPGIVAEGEYIVDRLAFPPTYLRHITKSPVANLAIIGVKGDSMAPTMKDDDIVMVDTTKDDISWGGIFVLRVDGDGLLVKRISMGSQRDFFIIKSDNPTFPTVERHRRDVEVVGRVIWYGVKV